MLCPVCAGKQVSSNLILYQINFEEAVYLCQDRKCPYPENCNWVFVKRKLDDVFKHEDELSSANSDDMEQWLNNILDTPQRCAASELNDFNGTFDFDEFEKLLTGELETVTSTSQENNNSHILSPTEQFEMSVAANEDLTSGLDTQKFGKIYFNDKTDAVATTTKKVINILSDIKICAHHEVPANNKGTNAQMNSKNVSEQKETASKGSDRRVTFLSGENCTQVNESKKQDTAVMNVLNNENSLTEPPKLRRSSRISKNFAEFEAQTKLKPVISKSVKSGSLSSTFTANKTAPFTITAEMREKIFEQKKQGQEKRRAVVEQCDLSASINVLQFLKALPHSK